METRQAIQKDKKSLKELWENSFHYAKSFNDWYFDKVFEAENTLITFDNEKAVSSVSIMPQSLNLSGCEVKTAYLSGLTVLPEYRNDENMKALISEAIAFVASRGYVLSTLLPPSYRFYERFGWRTSYSYKQYDISPSDLPEYRVNYTFDHAAISENTIFELSDIYKEFTSDKNAYALRSKENWELILEDLFCNFGGHCIIVRDENKKPVGYILSIIRDKKMWVYELAYKTRAAYENIMGYMNSHKLYVDSIAIKAPADDLSYLDFCDNREAVGYRPFVAARITEAKKALEIATASLTDGFKIQVVDRLIEANNKTFALSSEGVVETDETADVITDIGTLTQLFMGYISVKEACRMNLISGDEQKLKQIFGKKNNYINMLLV